MKKVFYVCDSYFTDIIASAIEEAFPESITFIDSTLISSGADDSDLTFFNTVLKSQTENKFSKDKISGKVDFFVLSAKLIYDGSVEPIELKKKYGSNDSKVIAVSGTRHFLEQVEKRVDITQNKETFMYPERIVNYFSKANN